MSFVTDTVRFLDEVAKLDYDGMEAIAIDRQARKDWPAICEADQKARGILAKRGGMRWHNLHGAATLDVQRLIRENGSFRDSLLVTCLTIALTEALDALLTYEDLTEKEFDVLVRSARKGIPISPPPITAGVA